MKKNTGRKRVSVVVSLVLVTCLASTANAELYLLLNIGDTDDREVHVAATTLEKARAGSQPTVIDSGAPRYFVRLPDSTMDTLSGAATRVDAKPPQRSSSSSISSSSSSSIAESVSVSSDAASAAKDDAGDTGWIEYRAGAASLMLFSPDGLDEESDIRFEPARVFLRRFSDGSIYLMMTDKNGDPPE